MEKISSILRGSSRVSSVDMKKEAPVRPGVPSFGRPVSESAAPVERAESTAAKAVAIKNEMLETNKTNRDHVAEQMTDQFFMGRMRNLNPATEVTVPSGKSKVGAKVVESSIRAEDIEGAEEFSSPRLQEVEIVQPSGFTPRGSYVNVHA